MPEAARKTFDFFKSIVEAGEDLKIRLKRMGAMVDSSAVTTYFTTDEWNDDIKNNDILWSFGKKMYKQLPAEQTKKMKLNKDGSFSVTQFEAEFHNYTSFMQRVVDTMPMLWQRRLTVYSRLKSSGAADPG